MRQAGRFRLKRDAQAAIFEATRAEQRGLAPGQMTVLEFFERWPEDFPRHPRTTASNVERMRSYVLPHLPLGGGLPLVELRRPMLREVQGALLARGLAKDMIDNAMSSLSAMLTDAMNDELIEANPARGLRVRPHDPRLRPTRAPCVRRAVSPEEVGAFMGAVAPKWRALCWTPFLTGVRPGELFALGRGEVDRERGLVFVHETANRYGQIEPGTKTTHHIADKERRGRWTLFPLSLLALVDELPVALSGRLFSSPRGRVWQQRNFYRQVWTPAQQASGTSFALYDARHTFASRLAAAGVPIVEVATWMGHSVRNVGAVEVSATTRLYLHATGEHRDAALAELKRFYERAQAVAPGDEASEFGWTAGA